LEYPKELHELHNEYLLASERLVVNKVEKMIPTLHDKTKYVLHHENLKQYLDLRLKLKTIHRGISFKEEAWMAKYIGLNTQLQASAKNEFVKEFYKLINNSVFGKAMENMRKRVNVCLVLSEKFLKKLAAKPHFDHLKIFDENLVAVHMKKTEIFFNEPVYLGCQF